MKSQHTITVEVEWDGEDTSKPQVCPVRPAPTSYRAYTTIPLHQLAFLGITRHHPKSEPMFEVGNIITAGGCTRIVYSVGNEGVFLSDTEGIGVGFWQWQTLADSNWKKIGTVS